jgi:rhodanese-related sulfurtransferase
MRREQRFRPQQGWQLMSNMTLYLDLDPGTVRELLDGGALLIDVREQAEHAAERIEGAMLHPLSSFDPGALPQGVTVILQCGSGKRSAMAMERCRSVGVACHGHLAGGIMAWKAAGLPTVG